MKTYAKALAIIMALVLALGLSGCAEKAEEPSAVPAEEGGISITDMAGRTVSLSEPASSVVALTAGDCEILFALGCGDAIVGRGEYCNYPEEAYDIPAVQSGSETNLEQIIELEPQVVFMSMMDQTKEQVDALTAAGIAVCTSYETDIEGAYLSIRNIGALMGKTDEAESMVSSMRQTFDELSAKADGDGSKTVYFEVSPLEYGLWTAGSGTFMDEIANLLGVKNAFADVEGWAEISEEQVIERDPDYIVTITMYYGEGPTPEEEIAARPGWQEMTAVKNSDILNADSDAISRPGPRLAVAASDLYSFFYGE